MKNINSKQRSGIRSEKKTHSSSPISDYNVNPLRGFTLIEMMVSVSIFAMVMLIGVGALLSLVEANKRAQAINSVIANLNAALEGITRSIRVGTDYHCSGLIEPGFNIDEPANCEESPGKLIAFTSPDGTRVMYRLKDGGLQRRLGIENSWISLTAPEITITSFEILVAGAGTGDGIQPRAVIKVSGSAPVPGGETNFSVQASVTQRLIDI